MSNLLEAGQAILEAEEDFYDELMAWADEPEEEVAHLDPSAVCVEVIDGLGMISPTLIIDYSTHSWVKVTEKRVAERLAYFIGLHGIRAIRIDRWTDTTLYLEDLEEEPALPTPTGCPPRELSVNFPTILPQPVLTQLKQATLKFSSLDCHGQAFTEGPVTFSPAGIVVIRNLAKEGDPTEYVGVWEELVWL